ncbi:MarR family winged helix-turn-helix transcriptional regulator [Fructilactobacillus cliffordii]|uniref:MarR family transcriptional regulator n=1 Tax=Fructilactobacillus cliffordii TaxID=2940299 RepID=A0A9Q8ZQJ3_9LACO|nr:MarR family transcriptional regulator [Fructilactobacillus cliffordii]USS89769.1 MarR family transcriptional regulator [Fructilactobacillus cliffordii]
MTNLERKGITMSANSAKKATKNVYLSNEDLEDIKSQLCFAIYSTNKKFNHFYQEVLKSFDLTYPQYLVMIVLWEYSPITVHQLGQSIDLDSGTLTPLLKRLGKKGWITKTRSTEDERVVNVSLTPYAEEMKDKIRDHVAQAFEVLGLDKDDVQESMEGLYSISKKLDNLDLKQFN